ncbi:MAG: carbohydrate kinase [Acidiferrobacterales bacterium]|nr:carbohydrate kinase [Acidiferrobacterales bacterium]
MYLVCGEALFDVFIDGENNNAGRLRLEAHPGGSPFNVSIGIARLGGRAALLTGMSRGTLGEHLVRTLKRESVSTQYLVRSGRRTTLSLVGVDDLGQPDYEFYGLGSADCSVTSELIPSIGPEVRGLHFGSYSIAVQPIADAFSTLATKNTNRFISVDPNVRTMVEPNTDIWRQRLNEYASSADLMKFSKEDLEIIYPDVEGDKIAEMLLEAGVKLVVITDGGRTVSAWTHNDHVVRVTPPATPVVDTVGAGDSFQAALLVKLSEDGNGNPKKAVESLGSKGLENLLNFAVQAARVTCRRRGADLPHRAELSDYVCNES